MILDNNDFNSTIPWTKVKSRVLFNISLKFVFLPLDTMLEKLFRRYGLKYNNTKESYLNTFNILA